MDKRQRDYTEYHGTKHNHLTVVAIEMIGKTHYFKCKCDCGKVKLYKPYDVLSDKVKTCGHLAGWALREKNEDLKELQRQSTKALATNKTTGHRNISYNKSKHAYDLEMMRNGMRLRKRFKTLSEAVRYKEEVLEAAKENGGRIPLKYF